MHHFSRKNAPSPSRSLNSNYNQQCDEKVGPHQLVHFCRNGILPALMDIKEQKLKVGQNKPPSSDKQTERYTNQIERQRTDIKTDRQKDRDRQKDTRADRKTVR